MATEADTCRTLITPKLQAAGWETDPHSIAEQRTFADGRIVVRGRKARREKAKRADFLLRYTRDFPIAVVEAKLEDEAAAAGLQQSKDYADLIGHPRPSDIPSPVRRERVAERPGEGTRGVERGWG